MKFQFTQFGFINALWSLIPIFPIWTIIPGVLLASGLEKLIGNCESSYLVVFWISLLTALLLAFLYFYNLENTLNEKKKVKELRLNFRLWNLAIYSLLNTAGLIYFVGTDLACNGDGQTILAVIFTAPLVSLSLILFGFIIDIKIILKGSNTP